MFLHEITKGMKVNREDDQDCTLKHSRIKRCEKGASLEKTLKSVDQLVGVKPRNEKIYIFKGRDGDLLSQMFPVLLMETRVFKNSVHEKNGFTIQFGSYN